MGLYKSNSKHNKKPSCIFGRRCFTNSSVCGYIGYYAECPQTLKERILVEVKEGVYSGVTPNDLFKAVKHE